MRRRGKEGISSNPQVNYCEMGFNSVYRSLQLVFPEVDTRILKAVAIEHSKDADAAAECILSEVLPFMTRQFPAPSSSHENPYSGDPYEGAEREQQINISEQRQAVEDEMGLHLKPGSLAGEDAPNTDSMNYALPGGLVLNDYSSFCHSNLNCVEASEDSESEELSLLRKSREISVRAGSDAVVQSPALVQEDDGVNVGLIDLNTDLEDLHELDSDIVWKNNKPESFSDSSLFDQAVHKLDAPAYGHLPVIDASPSVTNCERLDVTGSLNMASKQNQGNVDIVETVEDPTLDTIASQSGQICKIDLLEDIIEEAKTNKKTLFSAVELVLNMMREVELQEKAVEQAKEEALIGGVDIHARVEDLKQMLQHAMEANNMHAGEVYGEKAILATEVRELQSRVLSLSDERDNALGILDEMRQTLELRLATAEAERKAAEYEKLEKEESAQQALAEQELIMDKLVQESKVLQQQAEENTKLREFLVDRGRIVDMLQGEISVICKDVMLLKEKFDERVPLSKSVSSSQTSCILASSSSSVKSIASAGGPDQEDPSSETLKKAISRTSTVDIPFDDKAIDVEKFLLDEGWDLFENEVDLAR